MKYYIKYSLKFVIRLIIFYLFIYLISFLTGKDLLIANVHAEELIQSPKHMIVYNPNQPSNELQISPFGKSNITFWGYSFISYQSRESVGFIYDTPNSLKNKYVDLNFVLYNDLWSDQVIPNRIIVKNNVTGSVNSCKVSSSSRNFKESTLTQPGSRFNTVICENVLLTDDEFQIYLFDNFESSSNTLVGISRIFAKNTTISSSSDIKDSVDKSTEEQKKTNDTLKDDNVDSSTDKGSSFFKDFDSGDEGSLTDIVSLPLDYISHLNDSCSSFVIPAGNLGNITIPCLSSIWSKTSFANVINIASVLINGYICYKLLVSLFYFFKDLKDPDDDKVEVMDL